MQPKQRMNSWVCPKCNRIEKQPTSVSEVMHIKCPMNKAKNVAMKKRD